MAVTNTRYWIARCRCGTEYDDGAGIAVYPELSDMNTYAASALSYDGWAVIGGQLLCEDDAPEPDEGSEGHPIDVDQAREALTEEAARIAACNGCGQHAYTWNEAASCAWPAYLPTDATNTTTSSYHHELAEFCGWWVRGDEIRCPQCRPTDAENVYCGHPVKRLCAVCLVCRTCTEGECECSGAAAEVDPAQPVLFL